MKQIKASDYTIYFNEDCYLALNNFIDQKNPSKIIILTDSNTQRDCLKYFLGKLNKVSPLLIQNINIKPGEQFKTIDTCMKVWQQLSDIDIDRSSLIINLGGGVVTDLGGFVANTIKRGISYINVPTSLLAMVDASVGGKTGVDLGVIKNQIGIIKTGEMVLIDTNYLKTLPKRELRSGIAEMLKHCIIKSETSWASIKNIKPEINKDLDHLIWESVSIKHDVVLEDPNEKGIRKVLNYGHTLGHAIESYSLSSSGIKPLLHGEAIAIGLILANYLSNKVLQLNKSVLNDVSRHIAELFPQTDFSLEDIKNIIELLKFDKKNTYGNINFVLLEKLGHAKFDCQVSNDLIYEAFEYYQSLFK